MAECPCVSCGKPTEWRCADCAIGRFQATHPDVRVRESVAVCESPACRDAHERQLHDRQDDEIAHVE